MTATDLFFAAAANNHLPAAIPVHGEASGVLTAVFNIFDSHAEEKAFSANHRDRAILAIYACRAGTDAARVFVIPLA